MLAAALVLALVAGGDAVGGLVEVISNVTEVRAAFASLPEGSVRWTDDLLPFLGTPGTAVATEGDGEAVVVGVQYGGSGDVIGWPLRVVRKVVHDRHLHPLGHIIQAVEGNHPPEFRLNRPTVTMIEDQGELTSGDFWGCAVSDCDGDDQDVLFRFFNGLPSLPHPDPCQAQAGRYSNLPPPDNNADDYFNRGPLATRRLMNVASMANCPMMGGAGVGCGGGGRQWPEDDTGTRVPNTCVNQEEATCNTENDINQGMCNMMCNSRAESQGRYWCKWASTLNPTGPSPALPDGTRCNPRCTACQRMGTPPAVPETSTCQVRCWDDTRPGGAHARLEAEPALHRWGYICWNVRIEDDGMPNNLPTANCNCQRGCGTNPCNWGNTVRACIDIIPVNDCPSFKVRGDATILEDSPTCTGGKAACDPLAARGGAGAPGPGCLPNLGSCCCPANVRCQLNNWIYDISKGGWMEHPYQSVYFDVSTDRLDLFETFDGRPCVDYVPRTGQCGRNPDTALAGPRLETRDIYFTLKPNACGKARITVTARDDGGESNKGCYESKSETFELNIKGVNDPPTFDPGDLSVVVDEDSGPHRTAGWATGISPGPGDCEKDQKLTFDVLCPDPSLFAVQPAVDPVTGDLTFTPANNAFTSTATTPGTCTSCQVILRDDGGTNDGGDDTANPPAANTRNWSVGDPWPPNLCIEIKSVNDPPSLKPAGPVVVCEDSGPYRKLWAEDLCIGGVSPSLCATNELQPPESQSFTFTATGYDTSLVDPAGPLTIDANGFLSFTPAANRHGTTEVVVRLDDGGPHPSSTTAKFVLTVVEVNDPPTITLAQPGNRRAYTAQPVSCGAGGGGTPLLGDRIVSSDLPTCRRTCDTTPTCECFVVNAGGCRLRTACSRPTCPASPTDTTHFAGSPLIEVPESSGKTCITDFATGITPPELTQKTTASLVTNPATLFAEGPTLTFTSPSSADLCFTPASAAEGEALVQVVVTDDGGRDAPHNCKGQDTTTRDFVIRVVGMNDPPLVDLGTSLNLCEDSGVHTIPGWATLAAGPGGERGQAITVKVTPSNPALFSTAPTLTADGTLSFALAKDAFGSSELSVEVTDPQGAVTVKPGAGEPPVTITAVPVNDPPEFRVINGAQTVQKCKTGDPVSQCKWTSPLPVVDGATVGPANEGASQRLQPFQVVPDARFALSLFDVPPTIDATTRTLSFQLKPDADTRGQFVPLQFVLRDTGTTGTAQCPADDTFAADFMLKVADTAQRGPTYIKGQDIAVVEDSGRQVFAQWARQIDLGTAPAGASPSFRCTPMAPELVTAQGIAIDPASGTLTLTPAPDRFGTTLVTCVLDNGAGGTACCGSDTFTLTVLPKNDKPTFTLLKTIIRTTDIAVENTVAGIIASSSVGPYEEATQTLTFVATPADPEYFAGGAAVPASRRALIDVATGTLKFTPVEGKVGTTTISIVAVDDGGRARNGEDTSDPVQVTVVVTAGNRPPSMVCGGDVTIPEDACDAGGALVQGWPTGGEIPGWATSVTAGSEAEDRVQGLTAAFSNYNAAAFARGPELLITPPPRLKNQGTPPLTSDTAPLRLCPVKDFSGTTTATVVLEDDQGAVSTPCTFVIQVTEKNDPPVVVVPSTFVQVLEDAGAFVLPGFARVEAGPGLERATQTVSTEITVPDPTLFAVPPLVDGAGQLSFTPAANRSGRAAAQLCAKDNGGGDDTTCVPFVIEIVPVNDPPSFLVSPSALRVAEDSGESVVQHFVEQLLPGPADEAAQLLTAVDVSVDRPELFRGPVLLDLTAAGSMSSGTLRLTPAPDATGEAVLTVTIQDDGGRANGGVDTTVARIPITITPVNDPPQFEISSGTVEVLEDSGGAVFAGWAVRISPGNPYESLQQVAFDVSLGTVASRGGRPLQVSALFSVPPAVSPSGTLTFTPAPDAFGEVLLTVILRDNGGETAGGASASQPASAVLKILPVNDPPTFRVKESIVRRDEDPGVVRVSAAVTDVSPGPPNESGQSVRFEVVTSGAPLFSSPPEIAENGDLVLPIAPDRSGIATLQLTLVDSGGSRNGGSDRSVTQSITVEVSGVNDPPTLAVAGDLSVDEDVAEQHIDGQVFNISAGPHEEAQEVTVSMQAVPLALFATPPRLTGSGPQRTFHFQPAPDAFGDAEVIITATDAAGAVARGRFSIRVRPVNDPPTFVEGSTPVTVSEDSGLAVFRDWATGMSAGPANEQGQSVRFEVECIPRDLFATPPTIHSVSGTLQFAPQADRNGAARCTAVLVDDGGCPGCTGLASTKREFAIVVTPVNDPPTFRAAPLAIAIPNTADLRPYALGWALEISPGPADEGQQTVSFEVLVAEPSYEDEAAKLFAGGMLPQVDADGTLRAVPGKEGRGEALFKVTAVDSSGARSPSLLLLLMVVPIGPSAPDPVITVGLDRALSELTGGVQGWAAQLATALDVGRGTVKVVDAVNTPLGADVTVVLEGDGASLTGTNALLDIASNPSKVATRRSLHIREFGVDGGSAVRYRVGPLPGPPGTPTSCGGAPTQAACTSTDCVWDATIAACVVRTSSVRQLQSPTESEISTAALVAIIAGAVAFLLLAALIAWRLWPVAEEDSPHKGTTEARTSSSALTTEPSPRGDQPPNPLLGAFDNPTPPTFHDSSNPWSAAYSDPGYPLAQH